MPWRSHINSLSRTFGSRSACALTSATWAFLALQPSVVFAQSHGDISASPWTNSGIQRTAIPARMVSHSDGSPTVATLQWGAIQQVPNEIASGNPHSRPPVRDGQFYGLGAPQTPPRVQSQQVSNSTELALGPAHPLGGGAPAEKGSPFAAPPSVENLSSVEAFKPTVTAIPLAVPAPRWEPDPRWEAEQTQLKQRRELAERVSNDILSTAPNHRPTTIAPLERPAGWSSVEEDLRVHMDKCEQLLRRNAIHSGREEIAKGLRRLTRMLDAVSGTAQSESALDSALMALREETEFQRAGGIVSIQDLVASHSTPALKHANLAGVTAETASQHYRHYARQQFVMASQQHPWAADLLYAYGKTLEKEADGTFELSVRLRNQAVVCYQAALEIHQGHPSASAQLGYSLLRLDRLDEAQQTLSLAVQHSPSAPNWANLAEVYRRRGEPQQAQYALAQASQQGGDQPSPFSRENPEVTQIEPEEFARYSPAHNMAAPVATSVQQPAMPAEPVKSANFFSNLFR